ncbi:MAG: hypothetical protein GVY32_09490 [Gammaproteobacteria bacterium]|jgi:broad specificity phosphatase PhoE|nr:hypothetical protein [Gammaproteobacteria bacterium]
MSGSDGARLVLVRHGQASLGSDDYDRLSPLGHRQAQRVAGRLSGASMASAVFWTGTLRRHRETLSALLDSGASSDVETSADLNEFSTRGLVRAGLREASKLGMDIPPREHLADPAVHLDRLLLWFGPVMAAWQDGRLRDPEVGSWAAFSRRVLRPSRAWASSLNRGRSVIVVTSAGVIATVVAALAGRDLAWQRALAVKLYNASVSELALRDDTWTIETCNCTRHLDDEGLRTLA